MSRDLCAATTDLSTLLLELSTLADGASAAFAGATRAAENVSEQAMTVQRVVCAIRKRFREYDDLQSMLGELIEALEAADIAKGAALARFAAERNRELGEEIAGRLGLATGSLYRWTEAAQSAAQASRRANSELQRARDGIAKACEDAQRLLLDLEGEEDAQQACH